MAMSNSNLDVLDSQDASCSYDMNSEFDMDPGNDSMSEHEVDIPSQPMINGRPDLPLAAKRQTRPPVREYNRGPDSFSHDTRPTTMSGPANDVIEVSKVLSNSSAEMYWMAEYKDDMSWKAAMFDAWSKGPFTLANTLLKRCHLSPNMLEECKQVVVPMLCFMDQELLRSLIQGDFVHNAVAGNMARILPHKEDSPITYITAVAGKDGRMTTDEMQLIVTHLRSFLDNIDPHIQGSPVCPVVKKYMSYPETGKINYTWVRLLSTFVCGVERRIEQSKSKGDPYIQPCSTIGYTTNPTQRSNDHQRRYTNRLQGLFLDVCDLVEPGRYTLHFIPLVKACSRAECSWSEWAITWATGCMVGHGHFTFWPPGRNNPWESAQDNIASNARDVCQPENVRKAMNRLRMELEKGDTSGGSSGATVSPRTMIRQESSIKID